MDIGKSIQNMRYIDTFVWIYRYIAIITTFIYKIEKIGIYKIRNNLLGVRCKYR